MEAAAPELEVAEGGSVGLHLELLLEGEGFGPRTDAGGQGLLWGDFGDPRFLHVLPHSLPPPSHTHCLLQVSENPSPAALLQGSTAAEQSSRELAARGGAEEGGGSERREAICTCGRKMSEKLGFYLTARHLFIFQFPFYLFFKSWPRARASHVQCVGSYELVESGQFFPTPRNTPP